jgi:hypothetical protein
MIIRHLVQSEVDKFFARSAHRRCFFSGRPGDPWKITFRHHAVDSQRFYDADGGIGGHGFDDAGHRFEALSPVYPRACSTKTLGMEHGVSVELTACQFVRVQTNAFADMSIMSSLHSRRFLFVVLLYLFVPLLARYLPCYTKIANRILDHLIYRFFLHAGKVAAAVGFQSWIRAS